MKNSGNNIGKITISLSKQGDRLLRKRAERNLRSISKEVEYLVLKAEENHK